MTLTLSKANQCAESKLSLVNMISANFRAGFELVVRHPWRHAALSGKLHSNLDYRWLVSHTLWTHVKFRCMEDLCGEAVTDGLDLKTFLQIETSLRVCQTIMGTNRIGIGTYDAKKDRRYRKFSVLSEERNLFISFRKKACQERSRRAAFPNTKGSKSCSFIKKERRERQKCSKQARSSWAAMNFKLRWRNKSLSAGNGAEPMW